MRVLIVFTLLLLSSQMSYAQKYVIDAKCISAVFKNMATISAQEGAQRSAAQTGRDEQKKALEYSTIVTTSVSLYKLSLENYKYFGTDSRNIKEIVRLGKVIGEEIPVVLEAVRNNPKATIASYTAITNLSLELKKSADYVYSLISNGTVRINGQSTANKDGHNFLDAKDRMDLTNQVIMNLRRCYNILQQIRLQYYYHQTWGSVINKAVPWQKYVDLTEETKYYADKLMGEW